MSILIKGMEMPKNCYLCPFCDYVSARCDAVKGTPYTPTSRYEVRADWCPLVPVPPHGRLIEEADAIETAWMILRGLGYFKEENPQLEQTVREVFATAPAVGVEEHG